MAVWIHSEGVFTIAKNSMATPPSLIFLKTFQVRDTGLSKTLEVRGTVSEPQFLFVSICFYLLL